MQDKTEINKKIRQAAFVGWLFVPLVLCWYFVTLFTLNILWWGPTWLAFATLYMIIYFRWVKSKKLNSVS